MSMPELPETAWFDISPDWVCEVISTSTAKYDRGAKREIYAREGAGFLWIVDPIEQMIEVFSLEHGKWKLSMTVTDDSSQKPLGARDYGSIHTSHYQLWGTCRSG